MISAIYTFALTTGANRVIRGARIEHVCGDPTLSPDKDYAFGMRIVTTALRALTVAVAGWQVIAEHGTLPMAETYFALKEQASNRGEIDLDSFIANKPQTLVRNKQGKFQLFRVGDAVASRNIHAALYESLRLCQQF